MAKIPPLLVRNMNPPEGVIPAEAWADVVEQLGDLVIVEPCPAPSVSGKIRIGFRLVNPVIDKIRKVLETHGLTAEPWIRDVDWWRG